MMNKLIQLIHVIGCMYELEKFDKKEKGFRRIGEVIDSVPGNVISFLILAFGILIGWVHIPTYMGDGYSYDNFN